MTTFLKRSLPYCIDKQADGSYIALNRRYKPVGFNLTHFIDYSEYPVGVHLKITPRTAAKISVHGDDNIKRVYLYNDSTNPSCSQKLLREYLERLSILAKVKIAVPSVQAQGKPVNIGNK